MASKKAKFDILGQISKKFIGSGDPEVADAKDVVTYFSEKYTPSELRAMCQRLHAQVLALSGKTHEVPKATVPDLPVGAGEEFWVMIWNLGHQEDSSYRGKPQTVHVLETSASFFEKTFDSMNFPPRLALPHGSCPGEHIGDLQYKHVVGFTRVLAALVLVEGVSVLNLSDTQLVSLSDVLLSCLCIRAVYKSYESEDKAREESLRLKFQISESVRPSVFQIYFNLRKRVERQGQDFVVVCRDAIKTFNSSTEIEGYRISELEQRVVAMLPHQTETFFKSLEYHWQNYKTGESGCPLNYFESELGIFEKVDSDKKGVWSEVYDLNAFKNEVTLLYLVGNFLKAIKETIRKRQKPNLRNCSQRYRCKDPQLAMKTACLWAHFRPTFMKKMSAEDFKEAEAMFFRGSFEREFTDKVNAENEALKVDDFRFTQMFKSVSSSSVHGPSTSVHVEEDANQAQEEADEAQLKVVRSQLQKDVDQWDKHVVRVQEYEDMQRYSKRVHNRMQDIKVQKAVEKRQETHYPIRTFKCDQGVAPFISSCIQSWSDSVLIQTSDIYTVFWLDLTKAGNAFEKVLPKMLRIIGDAAASKPRQVCAVVVAPLVGARGHGADADAADEAHDDCEVQIKMDIYKLTFRRITFSFEASAKHMQTWCAHAGWFLYSNIMDMTSSVPRSLCEFTASRLCCQRGVVDLPLPQEKDFVLPTSSVPSAATNLSQAQRRLQRFSGLEMFSKIRKAVWCGMKLSARNGGAWVDLLGYDASLATSVITDSPRPPVQQPMEMVVTPMTMVSEENTDECRKRVTKWIQVKQLREIRTLIMSKTLQVPDVVISEWRSTVPSPVMDVGLLKVTMPTADNCLAMKQSAVDDWEKKLVAKHTALQDIIKLHDTKYNPSGRMHKTTADTSSSSGGVAKSSVANPSGEEAVDWPAEQTYDSMEAIKSEGHLDAMAGSPAEYTFHASANKIFIQSHADCILDMSKPLFHIWGKYHTGSEVANATKKKANLMPMEVTSTEFVAHWTGKSAWTPPFKTYPCPLSEFVEYLEENGVSDFTFACHEVTFGTEEDMEAPMSIKVKEKCSFEPLPYPSAEKSPPQHHNFGSKIPKTKVDWKTGDVNVLCHVKSHWKYDDTNQMQGVSPGRPGVFAKKSMHMKKGKVYALVF